MNKVGRALTYIAGFLIFLLAYAAASFVAHIVIGVVNSDVQGWAREYLLPHFVAAFAGPLGVIAGFAVIEKVFPSLRLRRIAWAFAILIGAVWGFSLVMIALGSPPDRGITVMAVQSLAALIACFRLSGDRRSVGLPS